MITRFLGREPRHSREDIEREAQEALDARINLGRPPADDFGPVEQRLAEADRRPPVAAGPNPG